MTAARIGFPKEALVRKTMALCSLVALACALSIAGHSGPGTANRVTVTVYFGPQARTTIEKTVKVEPGATAMDAVRKAARVQTNPEGTFLIAIENVANSAERKQFWLYFVNGEPQHVSAALKKLAPGDRVLWFLRKSASTSHADP